MKDHSSKTDYLPVCIPYFKGIFIKRMAQLPFSRNPRVFLDCFQIFRDGLSEAGGTGNRDSTCLTLNTLNKVTESPRGR